MLLLSSFVLIWFLFGPEMFTFTFKNSSKICLARCFNSNLTFETSKLSLLLAVAFDKLLFANSVLNFSTASLFNKNFASIIISLHHTREKNSHSYQNNKFSSLFSFDRNSLNFFFNTTSSNNPFIPNLEGSNRFKQICSLEVTNKNKNNGKQCTRL